QPDQRHGGKLAERRQPALPPSAPPQQPPFRLPRLEDDRHRADAVGDRIDDRPSVRAAFGDDDNRTAAVGFECHRPGYLSMLFAQYDVILKQWRGWKSMRAGPVRRPAEQSAQRFNSMMSSFDS